MAATPETEVVAGIRSDYKYGFHEIEDYFFKSGRGLSAELVAAISEHKNEPEWMRKYRLKSLEYFMARPMPEWGGDLSEIDFDNIFYYIRPTEKQANSWEDLPPTSRTPGTSSASRRRRRSTSPASARSTSPRSSTTSFRRLEKQGVIFLDMDSAPARARGARQAVLRDDHPAERQQVRGAQLGRLVGRLVHLRAAGRVIEMPLQAYFRINAENMGQFERTLILVDEGAYVHYVEGCTAPIYSTDSLHSRSSRSSSRRAAAAATRRSRTGRTTSTTSSRSAPSPTRTRRWSGSTGTSARS
jgi:ABC-type transport system involved in Fe-S cluster assembly, permease component